MDNRISKELSSSSPAISPATPPTATYALPYLWVNSSTTPDNLRHHQPAFGHALCNFGRSQKLAVTGLLFMSVTDSVSVPCTSGREAVASLLSKGDAKGERASQPAFDIALPR
ncbi:MAG: hypothetical protein V7K48_15190 [Nostoc sp.]|uniref:hypothetical protein n=1 Tax=Nostoc sp. TaxID=1180 RepID=UPI002FFAE0AA